MRAPADRPNVILINCDDLGYGTVRSNDGGKLEIEFEKAGTKKVMESFVEPA